MWRQNIPQTHTIIAITLTIMLSSRTIILKSTKIHGIIKTIKKRKKQRKNNKTVDLNQRSQIAISKWTTERPGLNKCAREERSEGRSGNRKLTSLLASAMRFSLWQRLSILKDTWVSGTKSITLEASIFNLISSTVSLQSTLDLICLQAPLGLKTLANIAAHLASESLCLARSKTTLMGKLQSKVDADLANMATLITSFWTLTTIATRWYTAALITTPSFGSSQEPLNSTILS